MALNIMTSIPKPPLEDNIFDILTKAQKGLGISDSTFVETLGMPLEQLPIIRKFSPLTPDQQGEVAKALGLGRAQLLAIAENQYYPQVPQVPHGFAMLNTAYGDMTVNAYVVWDTKTSEAAVFDTGADCMPIVTLVQKLSLNVRHVFATHTHGDHIGELERLLEKLRSTTPITIHVAEAELAPVKSLDLPNTVGLTPGATIHMTNLQIESRDTSGHSAGSVTYAIHGLDRPLSIVGDCLFAGSVGGIRTDYAATLQRVRSHILSGQGQTILACGHGPLTTIDQELAHNPFFTA